jgi:hypothetical protein
VRKGRDYELFKRYWVLIGGGYAVFTVFIFSFMPASVLTEPRSPVKKIGVTFISGMFLATGVLIGVFGTKVSLLVQSVQRRHPEITMPVRNIFALVLLCCFFLALTATWNLVFVYYGDAWIPPRYVWHVRSSVMLVVEIGPIGTLFGIMWFSPKVKTPKQLPLRQPPKQLQDPLIQ